MQKMRLVLLILGAGVVALGFTQCDGTTSSGSLSISTCDGGPEAGCPVTSRPPGGGW
jgi:hypothetical protein